MMLCFVSTQMMAFELKGRTEFAGVYSINSAVSGVVNNVLVRPGQLVKRDELLLKLDERPFQASVTQAEAMVTLRKPARDQMLTELERAQELFDRDSLALVELQQSENNLQVAEGELAAAEAQLELANYHLLQASISAPDDLLVLDVNTHPMQFINTAVSDEALIVLANHHEMLAISFLGPDQWDAGLVGKPAQVDYLGKQYRGRVISLDYRRRQDSSNSDGFELRVLFVASGEIPANMPVTIEIQN